MYDLTGYRDQLDAALRDIADLSYRYFGELQKAGFNREEAWEVMIAWNRTFAGALCRQSS